MNPFALALGEEKAGYLCAVLRLIKGIPKTDLDNAVGRMMKWDAKIVMVDPTKEKGKVWGTWGDASRDYIQLLDHMAQVQKYLSEVEKHGQQL